MHTKDDGGGGSYHKYVYIQGNIYLYYRVDIAFFIFHKHMLVQLQHWFSYCTRYP